MNARHDIGKILRHAREERELAVADVAHRTRIPARLLAALEANDYAAFSGPIYAKSFLQQYSEFLEVDAHEWLEAFAPADPLANLDTYEYLKPHEERIRRPEVAERPEEVMVVAGGGRNFGAQSVAIFATTFALIGAAVFAVQTIENRLAPAVTEQVTRDEATPELDEKALSPERVADEPPQLVRVTSSPLPETSEEAVADTSAPRAIIVDP